jgi:hypothetical protein
MLKKIESFIITANNYGQAVEFFKEKLGFQLISENHEMARLELNGFPIFIAGSRDGESIFISIECDDIEADYKLLRKRGIEFGGPINTMKGGDKAAFFSGPARTQFMLYQPLVNKS